MQLIGCLVRENPLSRLLRCQRNCYNKHILSLLEIPGEMNCYLLHILYDLHGRSELQTWALFYISLKNMTKYI
jgi:hypothetical protein